MNRFWRLFQDCRGASLVEFAIALPVLVSFIYGIFQLGMVFQANAGLQHALGEAARMATLWPTPTESQIRSRLMNSRFGLGNGTLETPEITNDASNRSMTITLRYSHPTNFIFFRGPTVRLVQSKRIYLA